MAEHASDLAAAYADAVLAVLKAEFPSLDNGLLDRLVHRHITEQATAPTRSFEVIVTYTRQWRLVPDRANEDQWRVQIACRIDAPTAEDWAREGRINEALRAITVDTTDRRSHG